MNSDSATGRTRKIYRIAEITRLIKLTIEEEFGRVWVEGELSNVSRPASGHIYFTLKDESAQIKAALFRGSQRGLSVDIRDGLQVRVYGEITVYERSGQYQIIVRKVEEAGKGSLQEAFEKLKKKLAEEGLFEPERKQPIPLLPQHVGVATSPTGAAIRDILSVVSRRFPNLHIVIAPVRVQGRGAAAEIAEAIANLNAIGNLDVMIVGRGGGSLEDLWAFNEEIVARAIAGSRIPIISAVGHETDFTISDFTADLRVPTPSAAAELVVGRKEDFEKRIEQASQHLVQTLETRKLELKNRFIAASRSYVFREPQHLVEQSTKHLSSMLDRMTHETRSLLAQQQQRVDELGLRLFHRMELRKGDRKQDLRRLKLQLLALSPRAVLARGYSITRDKEGRIVKSAAQIGTGDKIKTQLTDGTVESEVTDIEVKSKRTTNEH